MTEKDRLHNALGNAIGSCKKRLFEKIDRGNDLEDSIGVFTAELRLALDIVIRENKDVYEAPKMV